MNAPLLKLDLSELGGLFRDDLSEMDDQELLSFDYVLHQAWRHLSGGGRVHFGEEPWGSDDLIELHAQAKAEMADRGFQHPANDELDQRTEPLLREMAKDGLLDLWGEGEDADEFEKGSPFSVFGRFTGRVFRGVLNAMPGHKVYAEPFCGPAQFLHSKEPSETEVIADKDPAIVSLHKTIRDLTEADFKRLAGFRWGKLGKEAFKELAGKRSSDPVRELWRVIVLKRNSIGGGVDFSKKSHYRNEPIPEFGSRALARLRKANERLRNVKIRQADFEKTMRELDGKDTFFIIDPPYFERDEYYGVGFTKEDLKRLCQTLKSIKGKFILLHTPAEGVDLEKELSDFHCHRFRWQTPMAHMSRDGGLDVERRKLLAFWNFGASDLVKSLEPIEKGLYFSAMGGLKPYRSKILPLPAHKTYVEAFCGCGEMVWEKEPSETEVMADIDPEIIFLHRFCKRMPQTDIDRLSRKNWTGEKERYERLKKSEPLDAVDRFHRAIYLRTFARQTTAWNKDTFRTPDVGRCYNFGRILKAKERLKKVRIERGDWWDTIQKYDSKDTLFFLDPPYEGCEKYYPHGVVDYADMAKRLKGIKGKFVFVVKLRPATLTHFKDFDIQRFFWRNRFSQISDYVRTKSIAYVIRNFRQTVSKAAEGEPEPAATEEPDPVYNVNPPEDRAYRYVIQAHWRGRSLHHDLRIETADKDSLIGWTLASQVEGVVDAPVENLDAAREWSRSGKAYKIDFKSGRFEGRIPAFPKAVHPHLWMEAEGVTPPYPAPGSTPQYRGVLLIEDKGEVKYGKQAPDRHEYFLHGNIKGRLVLWRSPGYSVWVTSMVRS